MNLARVSDSGRRRRATVYRPDARLSEGAFGALRQLWIELIKFRWHIWVSFSSDFNSRMRLTHLGTAWNFILPLVPLMIYSTLMAVRVFPQFGGVDPIVYVTLGVTAWFFFAGLISGPITLVQNKKRELSRTRLPLMSVVVSGFAQNVFDTFVRLSVTIVIFLLVQGAPAWQVCFVPLLLIPATLLCFGLGLILAVLNCAYLDTRQVVLIVLQYGLFLSGVIFPIGRIPGANQFLAFNPLFVFIENIRSLPVRGTFVHVPSLIGFSILSVVVFVLACRLFYVLEPRILGDDT